MVLKTLFSILFQYTGGNCADHVSIMDDRGFVSEVKFCDTNKPTVYRSISREVRIVQIGQKTGLPNNFRLSWKAIKGEQIQNQCNKLFKYVS